MYIYIYIYKYIYIDSHMWDMKHPYVEQDLFICGIRLLHMWDMTPSYVGHDSFICGT